MEKVAESLDVLNNIVWDFAISPHWSGAHYVDNLISWGIITSVSSESLPHIQRTDPSTQRTEIRKPRVRIGCFPPGA